MSSRSVYPGEFQRCRLVALRTMDERRKNVRGTKERDGNGVIAQ